VCEGVSVFGFLVPTHQYNTDAHSLKMTRLVNGKKWVLTAL
jgi:hypothetical protein